jgi:hypothetical protein
MPAPKKQPDFGPLFTRLSSLLEQLDKDPVPKKRKGPGRPTKHQAATTPVIVHLYTSQVRWLDDYADMIAAMRPDNARLSRAEVLRGLLLGLGRFAIDLDMPLPHDKPIQSERDLQHALARALHDEAKP